MDHEAGDGDVLRWLPGPALHLRRGVVVAANAQLLRRVDLRAEALATDP
jgi:hypothetical protein